MARAEVLLVVALLLLQQLTTVDAACEDHIDCETCTSNSDYWISCRWCALTNGCHNFFSYYSNQCLSAQQVTNSSLKQCHEVTTNPSPRYNSTIADQMSKWSSLAYASLENKDALQTKQVVKDYIAPSYKIVEYLTSDCGMPMEGGDCAVVIVVSQVEKRIVIAFRGTETSFQLFNEFLGGISPFLTFDPSGGQILSYFKEAHDSLYNCVKLTVGQLLIANPTFQVYVTGHSLGGAEAQLTAVSLVADGLVTKDHVKVYTFGSPRVGGKDFAFGYDRMMGESWRVVNINDPIPKIVPREMMFMDYSYHTKREVYYSTLDITTNTNYTICKGNEDPTCSSQYEICLTETCVYSHMRYFGSAIQNYIRTKITRSGHWNENTTSRGTCTVYAYY